MSLGYLWAMAFKAPLIVLSTVLFGSASVAVSYFDPGGAVTDRIARAWARWLLILGGVRVRVRGLENFDPARNCVFAGNHVSFIDTPVVLSCVPSRFLFLVNAKYVKLPFLGTHLSRCGHFSVDPDDARASLRTLTQAARASRERGVSVLLFPEGTRTRGEIGEFKEGAAYIAIKAGIPVVPFALRGTREILPVGRIDVRGGLVDLVFGEPISVEGYKLQDRAELNRAIRASVVRLLARAEAAASADGQAAGAVRP